MDENATDDPMRALREQRVHYVVGAQGQPVAVLLSLEEYAHYLDLLDDEADSQDDELATRLRQAAAPSTSGERQSFRDYVRQREETGA
jgi:PHD/YefM family antitoxin component YafN of YafNO toxin-antitoxin module